jgi:CubicO group peptidase (beta-lactamase class C family)
MKRLISLFLTLVSALATSALAQKQSAPADQWASVRDTVRAVIAQRELPSVSLAVARGGKIIWEEAFGWANREKMIPATPNTMYSLASISKPITATAIMQLVEQKKVDLDNPANDYLGTGKLTGLAGDASAATVRRVMSHTAGLPLHYQFDYTDRPYPVVSNDETIARYAVLVQPPGEVVEYSNLGYGILDHIVARASGQEYVDYMRAKVFAPLGMTRTSIGIGPGLEAFVAERYDARQRPIPFYDFDHRGGSAVYSSAHDLVRFGMFHLKDRLPEQRAILADSSIDAMKVAVAPARYGLGWIMDDVGDGLRVVNHSGGMPGVATRLGLYPDDDVAIVVLTNSSTDAPLRVLREIERVLLPKYADARRRTQTPPAATPAVARFSPPPELVGEWSGTLRTWERTLPFTLIVQSDGDVHARIEGQLESLLNDVRWQNNTLAGTFRGTIPTPDASRWSHNVYVSLRLRGSTLGGMASAVTTTDPVYFALSSYASLTKKVASQ